MKKKGFIYTTKARILMIVGGLVSLALLISAIVIINTNEDKENSLLLSMQEAEYSRLRAEEEEKRRLEEEAKLQYKEENTVESVYQKLAKGEDISILVLGDFDAAATGASEESKAFVSLLDTKLEAEYKVSVTVDNMAMRYNNLYASYVNFMRDDSDKIYDLVIILANTDSEYFKFQYEALIRKIGERMNDCSIMSVYNSSESSELTGLLNRYEIPRIDTAAIDIAGGTLTDHTDTAPSLLNDVGHAVYADKIFDEIRDCVEEELKLFKYSAIERIYATSEQYFTLEYISKSDFERVGNTYVLNASKVGILGIDFSYMSGENRLKISVNGIEGVWSQVTSDIEKRHIQLISEELISITSISFEFGSAELADAFNGIVFTRKA